MALFFSKSLFTPLYGLNSYIKVKGQWKYLFRAVDSNGNTIDFIVEQDHLKRQTNLSGNRGITFVRKRQAVCKPESVILVD